MLRKIFYHLLLSAMVSQLILPSNLWAQTLPAGDLIRVQNELMSNVMSCQSTECQDDKFQEINSLLSLEEASLKEKKYAQAAAPEAAKQDDALFELKEVRFSGNDSIHSSELEPLVEPFLNHQINFRTAQDLVSDVKKYYRSKGFMASYAFLPPQKTQDGVLQISILEGKLGKVDITGNSWYSTEVLKNQLHFEPNQVLNYAQVQKEMTGLNQHHDIKGNVVLKPGAEKGSTDIELKVKDQHPMHATVDMNNLGTDNTGKIRAGTTLKHNNLTGHMDELTLRGQGGKNSWAVSGDYNAPINAAGTRLGGAVTYASNQVGGDFSALDIEGDSTIYSAYATQPIYRSLNLDATGRVGFDWKSIENRIFGFVSGKDELRVLNAGVDLNETDANGQSFSPHSLNLGLGDFLGASDANDDLTTSIGTGGNFFIYRGAFIRNQRLTSDLSMTFRVGGQWSPDHLPASEQLRLGGVSTVRGYQEGEFYGDYGVHGSLELLLPGNFFFKVLPDRWNAPFTNEPLNKQLQWVAFVDGGRATTRDIFLGERNSRLLSGFGFGLRYRLWDKVYARLEWARPLGGQRPNDHKDNASDGVFYFGISAELF